MEIVHDVEGLRRYMRTAVVVSGKSPVLIDSFLRSATEIDVDVVADGTDVFIAGVMEHIEEAGIHSGDSACSLPPVTLPTAIVDEVKRQTAMLRSEEHTSELQSLMRISYAVFCLKKKKITNH